MVLPVYTELANFTVKTHGKKAKVDLSIAMIVDRFSIPTDTINSLNQYINKTDLNIEFIFINIDKEGFNHDILLSSFPLMRVLIPESRITKLTAFKLIIEEALSNDILFIDENFILKNLSFDLIESYRNNPDYGIIIPFIYNKEEKTINNITEIRIRNGFIETNSKTVLSTSVYSLYPKYFCFLLNSSVYKNENIELNEYSDFNYILLELGLKIWLKGYTNILTRNFNVIYTGEVIKDLNIELINQSSDYLLFNFINLDNINLLHQRKKYIFRKILRYILRLKFKEINNIRKTLKLLKINKYHKPDLKYLNKVIEFINNQ